MTEGPRSGKFAIESEQEWQAFEEVATPLAKAKHQDQHGSQRKRKHIQGDDPKDSTYVEARKGNSLVGRLLPKQESCDQESADHKEQRDTK